jgi:hypothetical protein
VAKDQIGPEAPPPLPQRTDPIGNAGIMSGIFDGSSVNASSGHGFDSRHS